MQDLVAQAQDLTERRAYFVYEVARLEAIASERPIVPEPFELREIAFQEQFVQTIQRLCEPGMETTPEAEHESWLRAYEAMGWKYGQVRDREAKTHPDMVPYAELPEAEREKDEVFLVLCDFARRFIRA